MVVGVVETFSTSILLILLALFILHLIQGDAMKWLKSKFTVNDTTATSTSTTSTTTGGGTIA